MYIELVAVGRDDLEVCKLGDIEGATLVLALDAEDDHMSATNHLRFGILILSLSITSGSAKSSLNVRIIWVSEMMSTMENETTCSVITKRRNTVTDSFLRLSIMRLTYDAARRGRPR